MIPCGQEGLELPEDEEQKKKTEADKEKFSGLCKVLFCPNLFETLLDLALKMHRKLHLVYQGDEGHLGQED